MSHEDVLMNSYQPCGKASYLNSFSHIYVEKSAIKFKAARDILSKFKNSTVVYVENYKDVFNRAKQDYNIQKKTQNLILAVEHNNFIYKGSDMCEDFGEENFYYSSSILNCMYGCQYCYLRGLYQSGNIVIFVNIEDFITRAMQESTNKKIYLCVSYDSDLLAFEKITGFVKRWIEAAIKNKNLLIEVRTKSTNFKAVKDLYIPNNVIFAWTILPNEVIEKYELKVPSLSERLEDVKLAIEKGVQVRLSIEPIMKIDNFKEIYKKFVCDIFKVINGSKIRDINIGTFRVKNEHLKRMRKLNPYSNIFAHEFIKINDYSTYKNFNDMEQYVLRLFKEYVDKGKVF
ncbi:radical SAM protein [Clostridium neuense]|uniref:Radical SAM protein n=1 Tax=Clostridium neuense TaxID=1728934 RepID=A0ABW8TE89_9CLOT